MRVLFDIPDKPFHGLAMTDTVALVLKAHQYPHGNALPKKETGLKKIEHVASLMFLIIRKYNYCFHTIKIVSCLIRSIKSAGLPALFIAFKKCVLILTSF